MVRLASEGAVSLEGMDGVARSGESASRETLGGSVRTAGGGVAAERVPKRVLFVTRAHVYGGAEKHTVELIRHLEDRGVEVTLLCLLKNVYDGAFGGTEYGPRSRHVRCRRVSAHTWRCRAPSRPPPSCS